MIIPRTSEARIFNEGSFDIGGVKFGLVATPRHDPFFAMVYKIKPAKTASARAAMATAVLPEPTSP